MLLRDELAHHALRRRDGDGESARGRKRDEGPEIHNGMVVVIKMHGEVDSGLAWLLYWRRVCVGIVARHCDFDSLLPTLPL